MMKKNAIKRNAIICLSALLTLLLAAGAAAAAGSGEDPLISLSYLTEIFLPRVKEEVGDGIQQQIDEAVAAALEAYQPEAAGYRVVKLVRDDLLYGGEGCEIIWRSGTASAISPYADQGLSDITGADEVYDGQALTRNHCYNIPRQDGRGLRVTSGEAYLMVRGEYSLSRPEASE